MQVVALTNGTTLPLIGLGTNTFGKVANNWNGALNYQTKEIESAIHLGYTFLDTAIVYRNEAVIGLGYKAAGKRREDLIIQTKLPVSSHYIKDEKAIRTAIENSLRAIDSDYIDIVLIHQPRPSDEENLRIYRVLETLVDEGKIRMLGVSNFSIVQLDYLLTHARHRPVVNQIEIHPGYWNEELVTYCLNMNVIPQAWSPLFRTSKHDQHILGQIGKKYDKTWAQVVIRYLTQKGVMVITKSHDERRQKDNLNVFDFTLTSEECQQIAALNTPNFPRLGVLGGTGFIGKSLTIEALRIGYQVVNVSIDGHIMPQRHLTIVEQDVRDVEPLATKLSGVDYLITALNDERADEYLFIHLKAIELALRLNVPLIVIGTYTNLYESNLQTRLIDRLEKTDKQVEQVKMEVLDLLKKHPSLAWTYIAPSPHVDSRFIHQPYQVGGSVVLTNKNGKAEVSIVDLVDFALLVADAQANVNHQILTIASL